MAILRTRTLSVSDLQERLASQQESMVSKYRVCGEDDSLGYAIEATREELARAEAGETIREGYDAEFKMWVSL